MADSPAYFDPGQIEGDISARFGLGVGNALKSLGENLWDFVKVPGDVLGGKYSLNEIASLAPGYALGLASAGTPVGAATLPEDALGIFGGALASGANSFWRRLGGTGLARAKKLEASGVSPDEIFKSSGWFKGPDSKWRYTIPDAGAQLKLENLRPSEAVPEYTEIPALRNLSLKDVLDHPELFSAYPKIANYPVRPMTGVEMTGGAIGSYGDKSFALAPDRPAEMLSTLLHETQHGVQDVEGFARGGSTEEFLPRDYYRHYLSHEGQVDTLNDVVKILHPNLSERDLLELNSALYGYDELPEKLVSRLDPDIQKDIARLHQRGKTLNSLMESAFDKYTKIAGEVEARTVQEQLRVGDWSRPPWKMEGYIPYKDQIVLPQESRGMRFIPVDHDPFKETQP